MEYSWRKLYIHTYILFWIAELVAMTSVNACSLHLISSVGHSTSDEKTAAPEPDKALSKEVRLFVLDLPLIRATTFWQKPYARKRTAVSPTIAASAGTVPWNSPDAPSDLRMLFVHCIVPVYNCGYVCSLTLMVSNGCPVMVHAVPPINRNKEMQQCREK